MKEYVEIDLESSESLTANAGSASSNADVDTTSQMALQNSGNSQQKGRQCAGEANTESVSCVHAAHPQEFERRVGNEFDGERREPTDYIVRSPANGETSKFQPRRPMAHSQPITNKKSHDISGDVVKKNSIAELDLGIDDINDIAATLESLKDRMDSPLPLSLRKSPRIKASNDYKVETWYLSDIDLGDHPKTRRRSKKRERDEDEEFQASQDVELNPVAGSPRKSRRQVVPLRRYEPVAMLDKGGVRNISKQGPNYKESSSEQDSYNDDSEDSSFNGNALENDANNDESGSYSSMTAGAPGESSELEFEASANCSVSSSSAPAREASWDSQMEEESSHDDNSYFSESEGNNSATELS